MNQTKLNSQTKISPTDTRGDSAKLLSLLALTTGAVAMPQTSNADIVFTDLSANPVHVGPQANSTFSIAFPGTAVLGFNTHTHQTAISSSRLITGRQQAGYVRIKTQASFFMMVNAGVAWNPAVGNTTIYGFGGAANYNSAFPGSYNDKYLLFRFKDSTQGNALRYGWVEISLANPVGGNGPDIAIEGYAWDTTGTAITAGQVPEPSATALLALGALTLGAKGLRSWRKNRPTNPKA